MSQARNTNRLGGHLWAALYVAVLAPVAWVARRFGAGVDARWDATRTTYFDTALVAPGTACEGCPGDCRRVGRGSGEGTASHAR